jgi:hypothetical protein
MAKKSGKGGSLTYVNSLVPITNWTATISVEMAETTDSSNYDTNSGLIWQAMDPKKGSVEVKAEGVYDDAATNSQTVFCSDLLNGASNAVNLVLKIDTNTNFGYGNFRVTELEITPNQSANDPATWSATFTSTGVFTKN